MKKTNTSSTPTPESLLQHASWTHALARSLVGEAAADDLVQETWVAALQTGPALDRPLKPWLGTVLGNFARQSWRSAGRRAERERLAAVEEAQPSAADLTERAELQKRLMEEVLALDEGLREVLLLKYFENCNAAEIARRKGLPASTVKSRLQRGLEELRAALDGAYGGDRESWGLALLPLLRVAPTGKRALLASAGVFGWATLSKASLWLLAAVLGALVFVFALSGDWFGAEPVAIEPVSFRPLVVVSAPSALSLAPDGPREAQASSRDESTSPAAEAAEQTTEHVLARFLDRNGEPVAGVQFGRWRSGHGAGPASGADGRLDYLLPARRVGSPAFLSYYHPALATDSFQFDLEAGGVFDLGDIWVQPGGALHGRVVDANGAPLVGASILVRGQEISSAGPGGMSSFTNGTLGQADTVTDETGEFRLRGLLAGNVRVQVTSSQRLHDEQSGWVEIRAGQESVGLEIVAPAAPIEQRIEGFVLDPEGNPLAGVDMDVRYRSLFRSGSHSHSVGRDGFFRFVNDVDTDHDLVFRAPARFGWAPVIVEGVRLGRVDMRVQFQASASFELRVQDGDGAPVEEFACSVFDERGKHLMQRFERGVHTGGSAALWLPAAGFVLRVDAPGFALQELVVGRAQLQAGTQQTASLKRLAGVSGRVTHLGQALVGAQLYLQRVASERRTYNGFPVRFEARFVERTTSGEDGSFHFTLREPGSYVVRAEARGLAPLELGPLQLSPHLGARDLHLALTAGGSIHGRVQLAPGLNPAGKVVAISRGDCRAATRRVGSDGEFAFDGLIPGPWMVKLVDEEWSDGEFSSTSDGFQPAYDSVPSSCVVHEGQTTRQDLVVGSAFACSVEGRLELGSHDLSSWRGRLTPASGGLPVEFALDADGRFAIRVTGAGLWDLSFGSEERGGLRLAAALELHAGLNVWMRRIEVAQVRLRGSVPPSCMYLWSGANGVQAMIELSRPGSTQQLLEVVPAGAARLVVYEEGAAPGDPATWPTWMELDIPIGSSPVFNLR